LNPPNAQEVRADRSVFSATTIPANAYGSDPPIPAQPCPTVSAPLLLLAQDDADPLAIELLLETIYDSPLKNELRPLPLKDQVNSFPLHSGTERYLHRNDPVLTPELASNVGTLGGGIGAFISGAIAVYSFLRLRKLRRFEAYYRELGQIELVARGIVIDPDAPTTPLSLRAHLETRLSDLKCRVLIDFAEGGMMGEGLMTGIIAPINDTRNSLSGMLQPGVGAVSKPDSPQ